MAVSYERCQYSWSPDERISIQDQRQPLLTTQSFCVAVFFFNVKGIQKDPQVAVVAKNPPANAGDTRDMGSSLGWEDPLK